MLALPKAYRASSGCKAVREEAGPKVLSLGPRTGHSGGSGAFVAVTFGGSQLRMLTREKQGSFSGANRDPAENPKARTPKRRSSPRSQKDPECAPWEEQVRPRPEVGLERPNYSGPALSWQPRSAGHAQAHCRPESWRPRTPWLLKAVLPVVTVITARTISLQDLRTTPLALEAAVTIATVSSVYITNFRQGSNSRIASPQSSTCSPYIFL